MISALTPQESRRHRVELVQAMDKAINETLLAQPATDAMGAVVVIVQSNGLPGAGGTINASVDLISVSGLGRVEQSALQGIHNIVQQRLQGASMASAAQLSKGGR